MADDPAHSGGAMDALRVTDDVTPGCYFHEFTFLLHLVDDSSCGPLYSEDVQTEQEVQDAKPVDNDGTLSATHRRDVA